MRVKLIIKLDKLFSYEGDETLTYSAKCDNNDIGTFRNGYWVWTPTQAGEYIVMITASVGEKTTSNYLILNVVQSQEIITQPTTSESTSTPSKKSGCKNGIGGGALCSVMALFAVSIIKGKKK